MTSDADGVYGSGYVFGANGNLEGSFRADNNTGAITWIEDCHGDTYSVFASTDAVYVAGHPHYCGNIGGFPQTSPNWTFYHSIAFSKTVVAGSPITNVAVDNAAPTAVFTSSANKLNASFSGTGSTDSDGTVASYSWNFGDSSALGTGASPTHAYANSGNYSVTLTVTDNDGATNAVTRVLAISQNVSPTAAFTSTKTNLVVVFDGSGSTDSDGNVVSYSWDFGDSTALGTGAKPSHTYANSGTFVVTLTVTDNGGLTDTVTHSVTVTAGQANPNFAADLVGRTTATGFGTADTGGAWTVAGSASNYSVSGGVGQIKLATAGSAPSAYLNSVSSTDSDVAVDVSLDKVPNGGGGFVAVVVRGTSSNAYRGKVKMAPNGVLTLYATKVVAGVETTVLTGSSTVTFAAGDTLHLRAQAVGSGTTALKFKVWKGATGPAA
ncbi:MAG TPA: PKD domain-containing protein [Actinopolymorphaceae bacterium]